MTQTQSLRTPRLSSLRERRLADSSPSRHTRHRHSSRRTASATTQPLSRPPSNAKRSPTRVKQAMGKSRSPHPLTPVRSAPPLWLRFLQKWQHTSGVVAFGLAIAACLAYAYATHYQQRWSQVYQRTEQLRTEQQQLHVYQELLKNQVAQDAQAENTELVPPDPNQILFVEPAPIRQFQPPSIHDREPSLGRRREPLGY